ncbi:MAG: hypothetical protein R2794_11945 [Chitinophagales bacterium]
MKTSAIISLLFALAACSVINKPRAYSYANEPFNLELYNLSERIGLDTNAIYYNVSWQIVGSDGKTSTSIIEDSIFHIMKFFNNGQLKWLNLDHKPTCAEVSASSYAEYHYYKIDNSILKLEVYSDGMNGFDYWEGNIYYDSLVFFKINNVKQHLVYYKVTP